MNPESHFLHNNKAVFINKEMREFDKRAKELNKTGKGNTACFYLQNLD